MVVQPCDNNSLYSSSPVRLGAPFLQLFRFKHIYIYLEWYSARAVYLFLPSPFGSDSSPDRLALSSIPSESNIRALSSMCSRDDVSHSCDTSNGHIEWR